MRLVLPASGPVHAAGRAAISPVLTLRPPSLTPKKPRHTLCLPSWVKLNLKNQPELHCYVLPVLSQIRCYTSRLEAQQGIHACGGAGWAALEVRRMDGRMGGGGQGRRRRGLQAEPGCCVVPLPAAAPAPLPLFGANVAALCLPAPHCPCCAKQVGMGKTACAVAITQLNPPPEGWCKKRAHQSLRRYDHLGARTLAPVARLCCAALLHASSCDVRCVAPGSRVCVATPVRLSS